MTRWSAESSWAERVSLAHALIGWTRGTGLMGHNDAIVSAVEEAGVTTYSTEQMAAMLLGLCDVESKVAAAHTPITADLTGGLADVELDMAELAAKAREEMVSEAVTDDEPAEGTIAALPEPAARLPPRRRRRSGTTWTSTPPIWWSSSAVPSWARTARRAPASRWRSPASCRRPGCWSWPGPPG
ncbi:hypothetical protein C1Y40_02094 [Mycobacterium talmoniae]|uniref:Uncharacterized protein n=1 Tax=Mycobacterium talmoniae TaxID=1858794 RepID=A0A2S8BM34_9MYCO|nr:hypothetical protein C1Y40_02094 [Mycobacterium talmoniae]